MNEITFDELLKKATKRDEEKSRTGKIKIPNSNNYITVIMPSDYKIFDYLGKITLKNLDNIFDVIDDIIYTCCPKLRDKNLHNQIGAKTPDEVVSLLFTPIERNLIGLEILKFIGILENNEEIKNS